MDHLVLTVQQARQDLLHHHFRVFQLTHLLLYYLESLSIQVILADLKVQIVQVILQILLHLSLL